MRLPTFKELNRYVEVEGWEDKDKKSDKREGDHHRYVFTTPLGERLYTRISHGKGQIFDQELFIRILRDQLCIDQRQFWAAVDKGVRPTRPTLELGLPRIGIDAKLAKNLITKVGLDPHKLAGMSQEDGVRTWNEWLISGVT